MNSFFILQHSIKYAELIAAISGIVFWKKLKTSTFKWFIIYLFVISICEFLAYFLKQNLHGFYRNLYAYFVIPVEFLFFHWMYYMQFKNAGKKMVWLSSVLYVIAFLVENIILKDSILYFYSISYSIGTITLLVLAIRYFLLFLNSEQIIIFYKKIFFWINLGILIFYLGTFPYYGLFHYLVANDYALFIRLSWVQVILNILMYILFTTGIICSKTKS